MISKRRAVDGFTLVELLVVITIIGMLMALLLPAVNAAVEAARQVTCKNNQMNLAKACIGFETTNQRFPGHTNAVGRQSNGNYYNTNASWIVVILPEIGKVDLYDVFTKSTVDPSGNNTNQNAARSYIELLICPSDPPETLGGPNNSFVINAGYASTNPESPEWGIAHYYGVNKQQRVATSADHVQDGTSWTLLLSENVNADNPGNVSGVNGIGWDIGQKIRNVMVYHNAESTLRKINGRGNAQSLSQVTLNADTARPSSYHTGGVDVAFCDGNTRFLREDIDYKVYYQLMSPVSSMGPSQITSAWKTIPFNEADIK
jgi:prepilin-type N-terminal cleavage/methylation domain-containing protein/prepilin-type processing-associated H-X9-DG protein